MSFAQRCGHRFDDVSKKRGRQLYDRNRVRVTAVGPTEYQVLIQEIGEKEATLQVTCLPQEANPELAVRCSCPRDPRLQPCKHLWATLLELDRMGASVCYPTNKPIQIIAAFARESAKAADLPGDNESVPVTKKRRAPAVVPVADNARDTPSPLTPSKPMLAPRSTPPPMVETKLEPRVLPEFSQRWRHQIKHVQEQQAEISREVSKEGLNSLATAHEIWYVLDLEESLLKKRLIIGLFERYQAANGKWVPLSRMKATRSAIRRIADREDQQLVEILLGDNYSLDGIEPLEQKVFWGAVNSSTPRAEAQARLGNSLQNYLLPRLCATNRFVFAESSKRDQDFTRCMPLKWQAENTWHYELHVETQRMHGVWRFTGKLVQGEKSLSLAGTYLLPHANLVVIGDQLARLQEGPAISWSITLGKANQLIIPFEDGGDFLTQLTLLPKEAWPKLPPDLDWQHEQLPPRGRIKIHNVDHSRWKSRLAVGVEILYGGIGVQLGSSGPGVVDREQRKIYPRNPQLERKLVDDLEDFDLLVEEAPPYEDLDTQYALETRMLDEFVARASEHGFQVVAEGFVLRSISNVNWSVKSSIDWFNLEASVDFEGRVVALPTILAAVKRGEKYLNLGDGTHGMLPREWLDRFAPLAAMAERDGDALRFQLSQTMLLDCLLQAQQASQVTIDDRFQEVRRRLREQIGLQHLPAPAGFQGQLRKYQEDGVSWMRYLRDLQCGGCLADDMGLGKTIQVLCLLEERRQREIPAGATRKPSLVVVPRSLIFNWIEEAKRFTPELRVLNYSQAERSNLLEQYHDYDLIITTYGILRRDVKEWEQIEFDYAILDESQAIKNQTSQASKASRLIRADHRLAMTGTPVENHLGELWSLFEFLNPGMLGSSKAFLKSVKTGSGRKGQVAPEQGSWLAQALRPFILRRTKKQVLTELPERTQQTLYCEMDAAQRRIYDQMLTHYRAVLTSKVQEMGLEKAKIHVLEALLRLRQVACHPALMSGEHEIVPSAKLDLLLEQVDELLQEDHKILVFSQFTKFLGLVRSELDKRGVNYEYLDGQTRNRQQCVERFQQDPDCRLFLISLKAGGHGLNLTAADYVFILDPWWNPAVEAQAIDRAYRMGQTRHVFAYRMICRDTVEEKILQLQTNKQDLADSIVGEENSVLRDLTVDDLGMLLS